MKQNEFIKGDREKNKEIDEYKKNIDQLMNANNEVKINQRNL